MTHNLRVYRYNKNYRNYPYRRNFKLNEFTKEEILTLSVQYKNYDDKFVSFTNKKSGNQNGE